MKNYIANGESLDSLRVDVLIFQREDTGTRQRLLSDELLKNVFTTEDYTSRMETRTINTKLSNSLAELFTLCALLTRALSDTTVRITRLTVTFVNSSSSRLDIKMSLRMSAKT